MKEQKLSRHDWIALVIFNIKPEDLDENDIDEDSHCVLYAMYQDYLKAE